MSEYGVKPTGFVRKPLAVLLAEREQKNIEIFGDKVVQTPQSFFGQFNGIFAEAEAKLWEVAEDTYQSFDSDQSEGVRLDNLARLRLIERQPGESDEDLRIAISNVNRANTRDADFYRALVAIDGVTYAQIFANDLDVTDANGLTPHSVSAVVLGGDDEAIATVVRRFVVPGITSHGNVYVNTNVGGFCRAIAIGRPVVTPIALSVDIRKHNDKFDCPPPANGAIAQTIADRASLLNGMTITRHTIQSAVSAVFPNVEIMNVRVSRKPFGSFVEAPVMFGFYELPTLVVGDVVFGEVIDG